MRIALVEDQGHWDLLFDELVALGATVNWIRSADDAYQALVVERQPYDAIILDVMLPPGDIVNEQVSNNGLNAGIVVYEAMRKAGLGHPVYIFSNRDDFEVEALSDELAPTKVRSKARTLYEELAAEVVADFKARGKVRRRVDKGERSPR